MKSKYEYEIRVTNLKDAFLKLLLVWKRILAFALVCAVGMGLYGMNLAKKQQDVVENSADPKYGLGLLHATELEKQRIAELDESISLQQKEVEDLTAYTENSVLMQIDSTDEQVSDRYLILSINTNVAQNVMSLLINNYKNAFLNGEYLAEASKDLEIDEAYIRETIACDTQLVTDSAVNINGVEISLEEPFTYGTHGLFHMRVIGKDKEMVTHVMDASAEELDILFEKQKVEIVDHSLKEIYRTETSRVDTDLEAKQVANANQIASLNSSIQSYQNSIDSILRQYDNSSASGASIFAPDGSRRSLGKLAVFGFTFGLILSMVLFLIADANSGTVSTARTFFLRYRLNALGNFDAKRAVKSRMSLRRAVYRALGELTGESLEAICGRIALCLDRLEKKDQKDKKDQIEQNDQKNRIALVGTANTEEVRKLCEDLSKNTHFCVLQYAGNPLTDSEALDVIRSADYALLVEERDHSRYRDISKTLALLENGNVEVAGAVLL